MRRASSAGIRRPISVGVDAGGTWVRALAVDSGGRALRRAKLPSCRPAELPAVLARLLRSWRLRPDFLVAGSRGIWSPGARRRLAASLRPLAGRALALPDLELARRACLNGGPGVLVLAGTGSVACARDACGHAARSGGLGPLLGDEGSAFWIGRERLRAGPERAALAAAHRPDPVRAAAALARCVLSSARPEDRRIARRAQEELARLAESVAARLHWCGPVPVSWHGGLFRDPGFLRGFLRRLGCSRRRWDARVPALRPERAAALLPLRLNRRGRNLFNRASP